MPAERPGTAGRPRRRKTGGQRGSASVETVLLTPAVIAVLLLVVAAGRVELSRGTVESAAGQAARAASLERSPAAARLAAEQTARTALDARGACASTSVVVDTSAFRAGGTVRVRVVCVAELSDVTVGALPGRLTLSADAAAPLDTFRATVVTCQQKADRAGRRHAHRHGVRHGARLSVPAVPAPTVPVAHACLRPARAGSERGSVSVMVVLVMASFVLLLGLVVDGGRALSARSSAASVAEQAARAGADAVDVTSLRTGGTVRLDVPAARQAAAAFLSAQGVDGTIIVDGSTVTVRVTVTTRTAALGLVGVNTVTATSQASADAVRGVRGAGA